MEKPLRIMLICILAIVSVQFVVSLFFVSPGLRSSVSRLEETQQHLDSASQEIHNAKGSVDSIQISLNKFNNYVLKLQAQIDLLHKERELKEAKFKVERDSIVAEINQLRMLADTIELPTLTVYDSRRK
jgi:peptidoglycan hydrolase CwlO-like protein